jgi:hypothetical protein
MPASTIRVNFHTFEMIRFTIRLLSLLLIEPNFVPEVFAASLVFYEGSISPDSFYTLCHHLGFFSFIY